MDAQAAAHLYRAARAAGRRPALLESLGPRTSFGRRSLLGLDARRILAVRGGRLFDDGRDTGPAASLFAVMQEALGRVGWAGAPGCAAGAAAARSAAAAPAFPCWIGFLSYEFARHVGLPTNEPLAGLPEASFALYDDGWAWEDGLVVHAPRTADASDGLLAAVGPFEGEAAALPPIALESDFPPEAFLAGVDEVQERIRAGWVYQVNLSHRFRFDAAGVDPLVCYERLRATNPSPFFGILEGDGPAGPGQGWAVVSGSPERLFDVRDGVMTARPIAGTRPRAAAPSDDDALEAEMLADRKERAEHVMLVDLLRNDVSRVCRHGSVEVSEAFTVERYSHVMHLVSEVRGELRADATLADYVAAIFPGGTITGAPKESVMREIARLEPVARGAYTGAMGFVSAAAVDFNILIRSFTFAGLDRGDGSAAPPRRGCGYLSGGGGIVIESERGREYAETRDKVEALLHILGAGRGGEAPQAPRRRASWRPPRPVRAFPETRVLFVENHDSYSYNIVNYLEMLAARVAVVDRSVAPTTVWPGVAPADARVTHLIVGPGPGEPSAAGRTLDWVRMALDCGLPMLGICLGHQALGVALGARLRRAPRPAHGEDHLVRHRGRGPFAGLPDPAPFTRYNSLVLEDLPEALSLEAWSAPEGGDPGLPRADRETVGDTADGERLVMAVAVRELPAWGVQFHPESMLSPHGLDLLANFLAVEA